MTPSDITLDAGALIAVEKGKASMRAVLLAAKKRGAAIFVPSVVVAEVWRGGSRSAHVARVLQGCVIEPLFDARAREAGEALARVRSGTTIDAIVVATAASRQTPVVTSDPHDLEALAAHFGGLNIIAV